jgi:hypothetical protein
MCSLENTKLSAFPKTSVGCDQGLLMLRCTLPLPQGDFPPMTLDATLTERRKARPFTLFEIVSTLAEF